MGAVRAVRQIGDQQFRETEDKTRTFEDSLQKNNLSTFNTWEMKLVSKYTTKIMVLKENSVLFSTYISFKNVTETLRTSSVRKAVMAAFTVTHRTTPRRKQGVYRKVLVGWLQSDSGATECGRNHSGWSCCSPDASASSWKYLRRVLQLCSCALQPQAARCQGAEYCVGSL